MDGNFLKYRRVLPGGSIDNHETFEAGAIREINEEIGISIDSINGHYQYQSKPVEIKPLCLYESSFPDTIESLPIKYY